MLRRVNDERVTCEDLISLAISQGTGISLELREIIKKLESSSFYTFYLTGSFSENSLTVPNDLDFFCVSSGDVSSSLIRHGFRSNLGIYAEETFARVYRYLPRWSYGKKIEHLDIQLVHPYLFDRKMYAQHLYEKLSTYLKDLCGNDRKELWKFLMYQAARVVG